jgi:type I restriction enzyme, S subunit
MNEWKETTLGDVVTFQRGHDLTQTEFEGGEYPIISSYGILGYHNKCTTPKDCVTIGRSGNSIGKPFYVESDFWAHNTVLYVKKFHDSYPKFVYYLLKTINFKALDSGSAVPSLNRNYIHPLSILVPVSIEEQKKVADILSCLDAKIDNLRRQNETLEEIARSIFKHWFIDFEFPNPDGKPYKSSGGVMVRSDLGDIPEGWRVGKLGELTKTITKGTTPTTFKKDFVDSGINFIKVESISGDHTLDRSKFAYIDEETNTLLKRSIVQEKDILYTIAGTIGRYVMVTASSLPEVLNDGKNW